MTVRAGTVPSYFLESLLWNVPGRYYLDTLERSYGQAIGWLFGNLEELAEMKFPNDIGKLFGDAADAVWNKESAKTFIEAAYRQLNS